MINNNWFLMVITVTIFQFDWANVEFAIYYNFPGKMIFHFFWLNNQRKQLWIRLIVFNKDSASNFSRQNVNGPRNKSCNCYEYQKIVKLFSEN